MTEEEILDKVVKSIDEEMCNIITSQLNEKIKILGGMPYVLTSDRLKEVIVHGLKYEQENKE